MSSSGRTYMSGIVGMGIPSLESWGISGYPGAELIRNLGTRWTARSEFMMVSKFF